MRWRSIVWCSIVLVCKCMCVSVCWLAGANMAASIAWITLCVCWGGGVHLLCLCVGMDIVLNASAFVCECVLRTGRGQCGSIYCSRGIAWHPGWNLPYCINAVLPDCCVACAAGASAAAVCIVCVF